MLQICKLNINFAIMNTSFDSSNSPLVSFIITCRNLPVKQITECLDSITGLSLRTQEKEIIVIDDGSDVSIIDRLEKYRDEIIYVRQKKNGVSSARNLGLRMASGNFIQFINGEDKLIPDAYEHCLDIVRYNVPDIVLFNSSGKKKETSSFTYRSLWMVPTICVITIFMPQHGVIYLTEKYCWTYVSTQAY